MISTQGSGQGRTGRSQGRPSHRLDLAGLLQSTGLLAAFECLVLLPALPASARTWRIQPNGAGEASSIQAAINAATPGDVILVAPGRYVENIDFMGKDITLRSESGPEVTILDGSSRDSSVVVFKRGETRAAVLEGFTVTGGRGSKIPKPISEKAGGGIRVYLAHPSILRNFITANTSVDARDPSRVGGIGGGIALGISAGNPLVRENTIEDNHSGSNGAGINVEGYGAPEIIGNTIRRNWTTHGDGGGLRCLLYSSGVLISQNWIEGNTGADHGGGIYIGYVYPTGVLHGEISHNVIWKNHATADDRGGESGGGIWLWDTDLTVVNNTIVANEGTGGEFWGGGMVVTRGSPTVSRNIIAFNAIGGGLLCNEQATPVVENNIAWQNLPGDGAGQCASWTQNNGNVIADPLFCGLEAGNFQVAANSPALTHPAGVIGAMATAGCPEIAVEVTTWSAIKVRFGAALGSMSQTRANTKKERR